MVLTTVLLMFLRPPKDGDAQSLDPAMWVSRNVRFSFGGLDEGLDGDRFVAATATPKSADWAGRREEKRTKLGRARPPGF